MFQHINPNHWRGHNYNTRNNNRAANNNHYNNWTWHSWILWRYRKIILSNTKVKSLFHLGAIPLWIILLISICMVILTILAICVFLKRFQPDVWNSLKRRCPQLNRHNNYQVSPLNSCKSKLGLITRCFPSCPESLKARWFQRGKTDPSRDTCFLCLKKVIENYCDWFRNIPLKVPECDWDGHRLECAITNKDKLEHLAIPAPIRCFRCSTYLRVLPVYPVTVFLCDNNERCPHQGKELITNIHNR